jgi:hypothetical protein
MRIVAPDTAGATALAAQLSVAFGAERISLRGERSEVCATAWRTGVRLAPGHHVARPAVTSVS